LKQVSGKEFAKLVQAKGWTLIRIKGSHHIFFKEGCRERIVIPVHGNTPLKTGLLRSLMKMAAIAETEL
jgi:predicted RNA binding protein YcfA (HicA-like mRNA interferase family)